MAGVLPDIDGLGLVVDIVGGWIKGNGDLFNYYHRYHHYLTHGWPGALVICGLLALFARQKPRTALLCLLTFHLHLLCDILGSRGPGPDDFWPILYGKPLFRNPVWIWHGQWPLFGWQNSVIFVALLLLALWASAKKGVSFLEFFGQRVDSTFVRLLRNCRIGGNVEGSKLVLLAMPLMLVVGVSSASAQTQPTSAKDAAENAAIRKMWDSWNAPLKPFRIIGNIYYVGPSGVSSFLILTPKGDILIDTGFESSVPRITNSLAQLGFKLSDIKIMLNSHAHTDHCGGDAAMKKLTGAKLMASAADADLLATGGKTDFTSYSGGLMHFPPVKADRILNDGDTVELGGTVLTCHLTPGHTKGCTSWTMEVTEDGKVEHVLFFGSTSLLSGIPLMHNPKYPNIVEDYTTTFAKLKALPCDVFLAPHALFFDPEGKAKRLARGEKPNPFIDPELAGKVIGDSEKTFLAQLARERK